VHDDVKIVVVVESSKAKDLDPPFTSRFEKQPASFACMLSINQRMTGRAVQLWVDSVTTMATTRRGGFDVRDTFTGFSTNALESLLAVIPEGPEAATICQQRLLMIASGDGIVRILASALAVEDRPSAERWCQAYFDDGGHANVAAYLRLHASASISDGGVFKAVVSTFTSLHLFHAETHLPADLSCSRQRLGSFDTETALADTVRSFFQDDTTSLLLIECDALHDQSSILLAKFLVDRESTEYLARNERGLGKIVIFLTRVSRLAYIDDDPHLKWEVCYGSGWDYYHIDNLLMNDEEWVELRGHLQSRSVLSIISRPGVFEDVVRSQLLSCFQRISYPAEEELNTPTAVRIIELIRHVGEGEGGLLDLIKAKILPSIEMDAQASTQGNHWLVQVATDRELLELSSFSLANCVQSYTRQIIREELLKIVFAMEKYSVLDSYLSNFPDGLQEFAREAFISDAFIDIRGMKNLEGSRVFHIEKVVPRALRFPFSKLIFDSLADEQRRYMEELEHHDHAGEGDQPQQEDALQSLRSRGAIQIKTKLEALMRPFETYSFDLLRADEAFLSDVLVLHSASMVGKGSTTAKMTEVLALLLSRLGVENQVEHVFTLLWERTPVLQNLISLLETTPGLSDGIAMDEECVVDNRLDPLTALAYKICCGAAEECIGRCMGQRDRVEEWKSYLSSQRTSIEDAYQSVGIQLDDSLYAIDPDLILLERVYLLMIIQELAIAATSTPCETGQLVMLEGDRDALKIDSELLNGIMDWLMPKLERTDSNGVVAARVLASVIERFLYFTTIRFYANTDHQAGPKENNTMLLAEQLFLDICRHVCNHKDRPPVSLTLVVDQILLEVSNTIGESAKKIIHQGFLPEHLTTTFAQFEEVFRTVTGSHLEVVILDVIGRTTLADSQQGEEGEQDAEHDDHDIFFSAAENILKAAGGQNVQMVVLWYSHAFIKQFLHQQALLLREDQPHTPSLAIVNRLLSRTAATEGEQLVLQNMRMFLIKSMGYTLDELHAKCSEGGHLAVDCPWLTRINWQATADDRLIPFNPFRTPDERMTALLAEFTGAWEMLHHHFQRSDERMVAYIDTILEAPPDSDDATLRAVALLQVVFMQTRARQQPYTTADERARTQLNRLADAAAPIMRLAGRISLACLDGFEGLPSSCDGDQEANERGRLAILMSLVVKLLSEACIKPHHTLSFYILEPARISQSFMLAGVSNDLVSYLGDKEATTWYSCACGVKYAVANCGNVTHAGTCPACKAPIGGAVYNAPFNGQQRLGQGLDNEERHGYLFSPSCGEANDHVERDLTPGAYRALALLVHGCLLAGSLSHGENTYRPVIGDQCQAATASVHCLKMMRASWDWLARDLVPPGRTDLLGAFLHHLIESVFLNDIMSTTPACQTAQQRRDLERAFLGLYTQDTANVITVATEAMERYLEQEVPELHRLIQETRAPTTTNHCSLYYRLTSEHSMESLKTAYYRDAATRDLFPIIDLFFKHKASLASLCHLMPFITWTNAVRRAKNLQLSRQDCRTKMKHRSLWEEGDYYPGLSVENFQRFADAWNWYRSTIPCQQCQNLQCINDECKCVPLGDDLNQDSAIILSCLNHKDEARIVGVMMLRLAAYQNSFLREYTEMAIANVAGGVKALRNVPLQKLNTSCIIDINGIEEELHRYLS